ncbi:MAG: helix-turn-helix transcriptional regulator [Betaproteobacteria bacterium]
MKRSVQLAHIRQLCCLGYPGQSLMPALLRAVREFIGADSAGFFWVDAKGDMTNLFAERMLSPGLMRLYFERHYDGAEHPFRQAFLQRASASELVSSSSASPELLKTAYYNDILRYLDAHHVMYSVIRDQGHALGQLSLYRPKRAAAFTARERAAIQDISRYVAHAVSCPVAQSDPKAQFVDSDDEGLVVVDNQGTIIQGAAPSLKLLAMATRGQFSPASPPLATGDIVPDVVLSLMERLRKVLAGHAAIAPREQVETAWGRFLLSAYALGSEGDTLPATIGIHVRRKEHVVVRLAQAMGSLDLPPQQREVALLLAQGKSNQEISAALNVSNNTASYHVKQLFFRLDAHDRAEAVARILGAG